MLAMLEILDVSHNRLDGNFPSQWETAKLVELDAHDNALTGQLPASLAQLPRLAYLQLQVTLGGFNFEPIWWNDCVSRPAWLGSQWHGQELKPTAFL